MCIFKTLKRQRCHWPLDNVNRKGATSIADRFLAGVTLIVFGILSIHSLCELKKEEFQVRAGASRSHWARVWKRFVRISPFAKHGLWKALTGAVVCFGGLTLLMLCTGRWRAVSSGSELQCSRWQQETQQLPWSLIARHGDSAHFLFLFVPQREIYSQLKQFPLCWQRKPSP